MLLETEASFPCNLNNDDDNQEEIVLHDDCNCVERTCIIIDYYQTWMSTKLSPSESLDSQQSLLGGMSFLLSILQDYSLTELLNDFFHIKRFHCEHICINPEIQSMKQWFIHKFGDCNIHQCISLQRNNRNKFYCADDRNHHQMYFIDDKNADIMGTSLEYEEIVTQQILDMIHCFIYHGSFYALYGDEVSEKELQGTRRAMAKVKQNFDENRFISNINRYHHMPYQPFDINTSGENNDDDLFQEEEKAGYNQVSKQSATHGSKIKQSVTQGSKESGVTKGNYKVDDYEMMEFFEDSKYDDYTQMYEYTPQSFGIDMNHNEYLQYIYEYGPAKYQSMKEEVLECTLNSQSSLSLKQFNCLLLKASILLSTFEGKLLRSRKNLTSRFNLDPKLYKENDYMNDEICIAIMLYCSYNSLRNILLSTYFKITLNDDYDKCKQRHYRHFYHWGKILFTSIIAFGTDIYDTDINIKHNVQQFYYHNISKPILFTQFSCSFFAPTSITTSKNVAFVHMPIKIKDGIILELDSNNVGWNTPYFLNVSIFSDNPHEYERLFHGGASFSLNNIISVNYAESGIQSNLSIFTQAVKLLKYIIGDANMNSLNFIAAEINFAPSDNEMQNVMADDIQGYLNLMLLFDEYVCTHLEWLITNQISIYKYQQNIDDFQNLSSEVPLYITLLLNAWCVSKQGIIQLNMHTLDTLPISIQNLFFIQSSVDLNVLSLNWDIIFNLFPSCNKVWIRGLYFNSFLCEQFTNWLLNDLNSHLIVQNPMEQMSTFDVHKVRYKLDGIIFSCSIASDWKQWVNTAKLHSTVIKSMGWLITASPPKRDEFNLLQPGRVSFIKRVPRDY